ncbi:MAG: hypothetical protein ABIK09_02985 [Pseudomonadota bacterium]
MRRTIHLLSGILGLALLLGVAACSDEEHGAVQLKKKPKGLDEVMKVEYELPATTRTMLPDEVEATVLSIPVSGTAGAMVLAADSPLVADAVEGNVLMFGPSSKTPQGGLFKVKSKTVNPDGTVSVETEPATLEEAFDELHIELVRNARYEDMDNYETKIDGLEVKRSPVLSLYAGYSELGGDLFSITFPPIVIFDADANSATTTDQITVGGTIDFGMTLQFDIDIGILLQLYHLRVGTLVEAESELDFLIKAPVLKMEGSQTLATLNLGTLMIGPVPLNISLELFLAWEVGVFFTLETTVTSSISVEVGIDYRDYGDSGDGFNPYSNFDGSFDYTEPEFGIEALVKVYSGLKLAAKIFGVAGPYVQADVYIQLRAGIKDLLNKALPWWVLEWGVEAYVGVAGEIMGMTLFDYASPELLGWILGDDNPFPKFIAGDEKDPTLDTTCVPNFTGCECSYDPICFKSCGTCESTHFCQDRKCLPYCGDLFCDSAKGENALTCPADCGVHCGDGVCTPGELESCPQDCSTLCGNGKCDEASGESPCNCTEDCGHCCVNGECNGMENQVNCPEDCGLACGNYTCDLTEDCITCPQDCGPCCPNGVCAANENCGTCPQDCGICCGDGKCEPGKGESCSTCKQDCGDCCGDGQCKAAQGETCLTCVPDCGQCCGNGQCDNGEKCGTCPQDCGLCCGNQQCEANFNESSCSCEADCIDNPNTCSSCQCGTSGGSCSCAPDCGLTGNCCANICSSCGLCVVCGDGQCTGAESCKSCPADCGPCCGNGVCQPQQNETSCSCPADCPDDLDTCSPCQCGGSGDACKCGPSCVLTGDCCANACTACGSCPAVCGGGACAATEGCGTCPADCGSCCGNGICQAALGEDSCSCPTDCPDDLDSCSACQCGGNGGSCWCDDLCHVTNSCCADACDTCGACPPECGDGACEEGETCTSCPGDCGSCCGNGACEAKYQENSCSCPADCPDNPNSCSACQCGDTGGSCDCSPDCVQLGTCCANACGLCGACPAVCGNGSCEYGETCSGCPIDCGPCCGNGLCEVQHQEDSCSCLADCPDDPETCSACECGGTGGNCACDAACIATGTCCANDCQLCGNCAPACGDGQCNGDETCQACPQDCGDCCGNGLCEPGYGEDSCSCPVECPDDPLSCSPCNCGGSGGSCSCAPSCVATGNCCADSCDACGVCVPECGDGQCNGKENSCSCPADCPDDPSTCSLCECGGSGGTCGCGPDCVDAGNCCVNACLLCGVCPPTCGDGVCNGDETSCDCPLDCPDDPYACSPCECDGSGGVCDCSEACILAGTCCPDSCDTCGYCPPTCGEFGCEVDKGETLCSCAEDCGDPCAGIECDADPVCGFGCGTCAVDEYCDAGACLLLCGNGLCDPSETLCTCPLDCGDPCVDVECGVDPVCGVECPACPQYLTCDGGTCVTVCGNGQCQPGETKCNCPEDCGQPCANKTCGTEPVCGEFCGTCSNGYTCSGNNCYPICGNGQCQAGETKCTCPQDCGQPCAGRVCGNDPVCGVYCGVCPDQNKQYCGYDGKCYLACGNQNCESQFKETMCNCPQDCGYVYPGGKGCPGCCAPNFQNLTYQGWMTGCHYRHEQSNGYCGAKAGTCQDCGHSGTWYCWPGDPDGYGGYCGPAN